MQRALYTSSLYLFKELYCGQGYFTWMSKGISWLSHDLSVCLFLHLSTWGNLSHFMLHNSISVYPLLYTEQSVESDEEDSLSRVMRHRATIPWKSCGTYLSSAGLLLLLLLLLSQLLKHSFLVSIDYWLAHWTSKVIAAKIDAAAHNCSRVQVKIADLMCKLTFYTFWRMLCGCLRVSMIFWSDLFKSEHLTNALISTLKIECPLEWFRLNVYNIYIIYGLHLLKWHSSSTLDSLDACY